MQLAAPFRFQIREFGAKAKQATETDEKLVTKFESQQD
jgi:hypothetical protein